MFVRTNSRSSLPFFVLLLFILFFSTAFAQTQEELIETYQADDPFSYLMLASEGIKLDRNTINSGGIGIWQSGNMLDIKKNNMIASFLRGDNIDIDVESNTPGLALITSTAPAPSPDAIVPDYVRDPDVQNLVIPKNQNGPVLIEGTDYDLIEIHQGNEVRFTQDVIYIDKLDIKEGKTNEEIYVTFSGPTKLIIKNELSLGKKVFFNNLGEHEVFIYIIDNGAKIKDEVQFYASIDARNGSIQVSSLDAINPTRMVGHYIAKSIDGKKYVEWTLKTILPPGNIVPSYILPAAGKVDNVIGSALTSLVENQQDPNNLVSNDVYEFSNGAVLIEVVAVKGKYHILSNALDNMGLFDYKNQLVNGYMPRRSMPYP